MSYIDQLIEDGTHFRVQRSLGGASFSPAGNSDADLEAFQRVVADLRRNEGAATRSSSSIRPVIARRSWTWWSWSSRARTPLADKVIGASSHLSYLDHFEAPGRQGPETRFGVESFHGACFGKPLRIERVRTRTERGENHV